MRKVFLSTLVVFGCMNLCFGQANLNSDRISVKAYDENRVVEQFNLRGSEAAAFDVPAYIKENDDFDRLVINGSTRTALTTTIIKFDSNSELNQDGENVCKDVESKLTPFLGVWGTSKGGANGVDVRMVIPKTSAAQAKVPAGSNITEFDGEVISNFPELKKAVLSRKIGDKVELKIGNGASQYSKQVVLGSRGLNTVNYKYCVEEQIEDGDTRNGNIEEVYLSTFPNPTRSLSHVNFKSGSNEDLVFSVTDITGSLIHAEVISNFTGDLRLDYNLDNQSDGTYIFSIRQGEEIYNSKVQLAK